MIYAIYIFLLMVVSKTCLGVSLDLFFPFGYDYSDNKFFSNDDSSVTLVLNGRFVFYDRSYTTVHVNNNGLLSFVSAVSAFTPERFPLSYAVPVIAPFWADVDTEGTGNVWYGQTIREDMLMKVKEIVAKAFPSHPPFNASEVLFIATWDKVGYYSSHIDKTNTFQCILASDGLSSYVIFMYADNEIQWTTGDASGGTNGLGGIPAQAGIDAGNLKNFTLIEGSFTNDIINIDKKSNANWPGLFVFRVNNVIEQAGKDRCRPNKTLIMSPSANPELTIKILWPETNIGKVAKVKCPCGNITLGTDALVATRYCGGDFTNGGKWSDPYVSPCNFSDLSRGICNLVELEVYERISRLDEITSEALTLEKTEVAISVSVLVTATEDVSGNLTLSKSFLNVVDNILQATSETLKESQQNFNTSAKILEAIQSVADSIPIENTSQPVIIARSQFAVSAQEVEPDQFMQTFSFTAEDHSHISNISRINANNLYFGEMMNKSTASISLPNNLFNALHNISKSRVTHAIYLSESAFLRRENSNLEVSSVIISASVVGASPIKGLKNPPVILSFKILKTDEDPVCSFWDPTLDSGYGNWSNIGCYVNSSNDDEVICHCDHLTSFCILLDVSPSIEPIKSPFSHTLNAATYIGIIISMFCLVIVSASYLYSRKLRNSEHGQLLMNLCFALMGLYLSFIFALHSTPVIGLCAFFSALLQYFFLVTFMSMTAEAINLYFKLVVVLGYKISHYVIKAVTVSWVLPLFIVVFCFAPKYENYVSQHFCRVFNAPYYVGMVVPFLIFYIFNWLIFGVIFVSLIHKRFCSSVKETDKEPKSSFLHQQLIVVVSLSVLFGLGWGIGLFATQDAHSSETVRDILSAIFVLITAFHGLFIFIMNGIRSKDVRNIWKQWFRLATRKNFDEFRSSTISRFRSIKERGITSTTNPTYAPSFTFGRKTFQRSTTDENPYKDVKAVNALHEEIPAEKREWSEASERESRQQEERHGLAVLYDENVKMREKEKEIAQMKNN